VVTLLAALLVLQGGANPKFAALQDFEQRISDYVKLENNLAKGIAVNKPTEEPHIILERQHELARKIREARAKARQGDIFTPAISKEFNRLLGLAMAGGNNVGIQKSLAHSEPVHLALHVNETYPADVPLQSTPPTILMNLPRLPPELEYRIDAHALVLRDTGANLVIDLIPNAIP
jgi:hypothetical protein